MMPVLTAAQLREADQRTIRKAPIASIDLMERAAKACFHQFLTDLRTGALPPQWQRSGHRITVLAGTGNNGGDGLALARMLHQAGLQVQVLFMAHNDRLSPDASLNLERARQAGVPVTSHSPDGELPVFAHDHILFDALFGTGLSRPLEGWHAAVVAAINGAAGHVIAIDLPSGLNADLVPLAKDAPVVRASRTYAIGCAKPALLLPEHHRFTGAWTVLDIGLMIPSHEQAPMAMVEAADVASWLPMRAADAHKGHFGHALIVAGSAGMHGAAIMATRAALRSGAGLVSACVQDEAVALVHAACPEAMCVKSPPRAQALERYSAAAIGPGLGTGEDAQRLVRIMLAQQGLPLVIDADAINILAADKELLGLLPAGAVLTPHPGEFDRLCGGGGGTAARLERAQGFAKRHGVVLVLKGGPTVTVLPDGVLRWNSTGNAGMARGGSGDALTGLIAGLLAQGLAPEQAAMAGVFLHGLAGDMAAACKGMDGMVVGDLVEALPGAFMQVRATPGGL